MRQLPATSSSGATGTENSRSRNHHTNETPGKKTLTNGSVKEPILTRSKSRLRVGSRLSGRSLKTSSRQKSNEVDGTPRRRPEKSSGNTTSSSIASPLPSPKSTTGVSSEKMYARHYKSYRGLNGVKSRRGEHSEEHSNNSNGSGNKDSSENSNSNQVLTREKNKKSEGLNLRRNRSVSTRNHSQQNGISNNVARTGMPTSRTRIRQVVLNRRRREIAGRRRRGELLSNYSSPPTSPNGKHPANSPDSPQSKDKAGKRRSALWVLNCEAESFLFGETAAEKHEVELPPLSPPSPPPKKRRWRVNELGHLLEKSPILESKLRKSSSSESGEVPRDPSPPRKKIKPEVQRAASRVKNRKRKEKTLPEMCSSNSVKDPNSQPQPQPESPKPELLSPIPFLYSPDSIDHEARTVQFQQMLTSVDWGFSFEEPPVNEPWYNAFTRTETSIIPHSSFVNPLQESLVLPYEMDKTVRRSRSKPARNSRKSPRCHASTIAILASERPTRSTRSSVTLDTSPSSSINNLQSESTLQALLLPPPLPSSAPANTAPVVTPRVLSPPKYVTPTTVRRRHLSSSPRPNQSESKKEELGAAQYLWDSIQFLSDPYVVTLLSGEDPETSSSGQLPDKSKCKGLSKTHRCNNNNYVNCPVKHLVKNFETSERKASLRSGDGSGVSANISVHSNGVSNSRLVSVPKSSPRNQSHGTNNISGHKVASPPVSPSASVTDRFSSMNGVTRRFTSRSPPLSPPTRQTVCPARLSPKNSKGTNSKQSKSVKGSSGAEGDNGIISHDKSKKSIVLVADLISATDKTKLSNWEEETLFAGDGLPPLPSWPV